MTKGGPWCTCEDCNRALFLEDGPVCPECKEKRKAKQAKKPEFPKKEPGGGRKG